MIKVFSTAESPNEAGAHLTSQFENWVKTFPKGVEIRQVHTNSNKFGWSLTILYWPKS